MTEQIELEDKIVEFANRTDELNVVCRPTAESMIIIDAPAGFGKTCLLKAIQQQHEHGIRSANDEVHTWECGFIDLQDHQGDNAVSQIRKEIIKKITKKDAVIPDSADSDEADLILKDTLAKFDRVLLMFDSIERSDDSALRWLHKKLIPELFQVFKFPAKMELKVLLSGRYAEIRSTDMRPDVKQYRPSWYESGYRCLTLTPFTVTIVEEILSRKLNANPENKITLKDLSDGIMELSGGHPQTIANLVSYMAESNWAVNFSNPKERKQLYEACIRREIEKVLNGIVDKNLQKDLETLSVFRVFDLNTIEFLRHKQELLAQKEILALFVQLNKTGLIARNGFGYSDSLVRNLILTRMRIKEPDRYTTINNIALSLYERWISATIKSPSRPGREASTLATEFIQEAIYHLGQLPNITEAEAIKKLRKYADHLKRAGFTDAQYRQQLVEHMLHDPDLRGVFKQVGIETLLDKTFNVYGTGRKQPDNELIKSLQHLATEHADGKSTTEEFLAALKELIKGTKVEDLSPIIDRISDSGDKLAVEDVEKEVSKIRDKKGWTREMLDKLSENKSEVSDWLVSTVISVLKSLQ